MVSPCCSRLWLVATIAEVQQLFDLPVYRSHRWIFNCSTVVGENDLAIVDAGLPSVADDVIEGLHRLGHDAADIDAVACTHSHPDHVGGMPRILEEVDTETHFPGRCQAYLAGERPRAFGLNDAIRFMPVWAEEKFSFTTMREFARVGRSIGFGGPKDLTLPFAPSGFLEHGVEPPADRKSVV